MNLEMSTKIRIDFENYMKDNYYNLHKFSDHNKIASSILELTEGFKKSFKDKDVEIAHIFLNDYINTVLCEVGEFHIHTVDRNSAIVSPSIRCTIVFRNHNQKSIIFLPEKKYCHLSENVYCETFDEVNDKIEHSKELIYTCQMGYLANYKYLINSGYKVYIATDVHRLGTIIPRELIKEDFINTNPFELWLNESLWED